MTSPRRRNLDRLVAWVGAAGRGDRASMLALLAPAATWQGIRPEWACSTPDEIVDMWLRRDADLDDASAVELSADDHGAMLRLRAASLAALDPRLLGVVHIGFEFDDEGRIARMVDGTRPQEVRQADPDSAPAAGEGWFVVNVADTTWKTGYFGAYTVFDAGAKFEQIGVNIGVLDPGQPACWYHREADQEDFLVLKGEALLIVAGEERELRAWDFVHCPPWTEHVFVGAGEGPCTILALGGRTRDAVVYPVSAAALRHGAGVREQTTVPAEAYAEIPDDVPGRFDPQWLPGS